ncbi:hypothetical protein BCR34DRAFT_600936 [Clohesyomyces aquaticus]|uniref:Uncharacterized protein n=1 Tax=Clohesyomyces aquaticus TaxID=1231657 RepID=A0A1Y1ZP29_9PLEO|nr:hypothetical protein BCR34DRAFT_600936 [Clohesyomyces aquaticus]
MSGREVAQFVFSQSAHTIILEEVCLDDIRENGVLSLLLDRYIHLLDTSVDSLAFMANQLDHNTMAQLLGQREQEIRVTEHMLEAAARNEDHGKDMMELLLEKKGLGEDITEQVVEAAAGNWRSGRDIMALLLHK